MQTTIKDVSPAERELEINATADELADDFEKALRAQRRNVDMKGFRKGKVPLSLMKKMYGKAIGMKVAEDFVQNVYEQEVVEPGELDVLGQPQMTELDYEPPEGDLRAVIRFGVRPEVELQDVSDEEIPKLKHEVTDEEVEEEIEQLRLREADLIPTEEPAGEESFIVFDLQEIDPETDTPIVGQRDENQSLFLDSPQVERNPMLQELKDTVLGHVPGDTMRFDFEHAQAHEGHAEGEPHRHRFELELKEVKERELPPLDDAFIAEVTDDEYIDLESFRADVREHLEEAWEKRARELLQGKIVERMLELHPVPVPETAVEMYLDSFVEDVKQRNDGELPEDFDETYFRQQNRDEAQQQAHWMLIRDQIIEENDLEVTDEDLQDFFAEQADEDERLSPDQLEQFYRSMPRLMSRVEQQVLSRKVFRTLEERFNVVELDREAFEERAESELAARQPAAPAAAASPGEATPAAKDDPTETPGSSIITP